MDDRAAMKLNGQLNFENIRSLVKPELVLVELTREPTPAIDPVTTVGGLPRGRWSNYYYDDASDSRRGKVRARQRFLLIFELFREWCVGG